MKIGLLIFVLREVSDFVDAIESLRLSFIKKQSETASHLHEVRDFAEQGKNQFTNNPK